MSLTMLKVVILAILLFVLGTNKIKAKSKPYLITSLLILVGVLFTLG